MHPEVKKFSEIWFSNVLRYSRRDQLSIIHSALQSNLMINGFYLDNHSSIYHQWPVINKDRKYRLSQNNIYKLPQEFFQEILRDLSSNDEEIKNIDFTIKIKEAFLKFNKSFNEFENLENEKIRLEEDKKNLAYELNAIKNSRIWRYSSLFRKILDKIKNYRTSFYTL